VKERKLSGRAIEKLCRQLHATPVVYRPRTEAERKQLDDLMATGTAVRFGLRDEEERKQYADQMAAAAAAAVKKRLLNPPSEEQKLNQEVWLALKLLLGESLGESLDGPLDKDQTLQSEKLHFRWWAVAALHKKGLTWEDADEEASLICRCSPYAGAPLTMKQAYVTVARIRCAIKREREREAKARLAN
jgi:hypothetical protein